MWNSYIKPVWEKISRAITDSAIFKAAAKLWNSLLNAVHKVFEQIAKWWNDFKKWLGLDGNATITTKQEVSITGDTSVTDLGNVDGSVGTYGTPDTNIKGGAGGKVGTSGSKGGKSTSTSTTKAEPTKGSLNDTEAQISALQSQLKNTDTNDKEAVAALRAKIAELQKIAEAQKIELGLTIPKSAAPEGSLKDIQIIQGL